MSNLGVFEFLTECGHINRGHFRLTSGRHSDIYCNRDAIFSDPHAYAYIINMTRRMLEVNDAWFAFTAVTAPAVAGISLASPIALQDPLRIYTYTEKKAHLMVYRGAYKKVLRGARVLITEDVITTGGSVQKVINAVNDCGGEVVCISSIWNRTGWTYGDVPVLSLIDKLVDSWFPIDCPLCQAGVPLQDPKG